MRGGKSGSRSSSGSAGTAPRRRAFRFGFPFCSCCLFRGVCLAAAARKRGPQKSASVASSFLGQSFAALVYDKLTPNCHLLNLIWKKADINYGACLYVCIEFSIISKRAVQRIVPLPNARFPVVYRSPADSEFGTHFCLPHSVHIAVEYCEFQCG